MIKLAALALKGPMIAASVSTGLLMAGLILPFLLGPLGALASLGLVWASAGVLALVLLRRGEQPALFSLGAAMVLVSVLSLLLGGGMKEMLMLTLQFWMPALLLAYVLRRTVSLDLAVVAGAVVGLVSVLLMHIIMGDPEAAWQTLFQGQLRLASEKLSEMASDSSISSDTLELREQLAALESSVGVMAKLATPVLGIMMMLTGVTSVLLARSWQAKLFNPGGFQQEFHELRMGKGVSLVVLVTTTIAMFMKVPMLNHFAIVMLAAVLFQGLAVVHSLVKKRGMSKSWLVGIYAMLLLPHTSALLGALGLADNWLDFRDRVKPGAGT